jgi:hypothetical protein
VVASIRPDRAVVRGDMTRTFSPGFAGPAQPGAGRQGVRIWKIWNASTHFEQVRRCLCGHGCTAINQRLQGADGAQVTSNRRC